MVSRRVVSPRIVPAPNYGARAFFLLLMLTAIGVAIGAVFLLWGQLLPATVNPMVESMDLIEQERDALTVQAEELRQQIVMLKQSQQIDRETNRAASEQLKAAQDERLALEKEVSFLRRMIHEGDGGILQPMDLELKKTENTREFGYGFTIRQLIQDFGKSSGSVHLKVVGKRNGEEIALSLSKLNGSEPTSHKMSFKHFQKFEGSILIPEDFEPENLVVEIEPDTDNLVPVSEIFPWSPEQ